MAKLLLFGFGAVALFMSAVFGWIGWSSRRQAGQAVGLPPLDDVAIAAAEIGATGYVEGRLSERNPYQFRDFVLYFRSVLRGVRTESSSGVGGQSGRRPVWKPVDKVLPPLWIETAKGDVRAVGNYNVTFQGRDPIWITTEELEPGVTERYEGLYVDQTVTVVGRVIEIFDGQGLEAETLASGSFEDYVSGERGSAVFGLVAGAVLGLVGLVLIVIGATI